MATKPNNEPAFPSPDYQQNGGMSKRELIAAMALQGLCASGHKFASAQIRGREITAQAAVLMTDALLAELKKEETK